ncbi:MAG: KGK domain-containing protein [Okeania sp. SIO2F4]|uniref:KGK domain-containing protein n=1 Tax=Microcoleaceae TaxID=1892252 RepID=UPI00142C88BC|nr:KGK domain-containing protein [Okeania sp. SIO2F4]MDJ0516675.1 KGK domain-containing protein [Trichodesmium sp. MO_231.B1]NES07398.1 KGK domain-containing protein [Okeania sp. SIO2F4]
METEVHLLNNDDVLSTGASLLMFQCTFKVSEYITMILARLESENLFEDGLECQLLKPGSYWKKGKVKLRLEFYTETYDTVSKKGLSETAVSSIAQSLTYLIQNSEEIPQDVGMWS